MGINFKILSLGDPHVGKSCLIKRFCEGRFNPNYITTIGVDYGVKKLNILNNRVAINFFDISGAEEFTLISREFISYAQGILLVFDLTSKESFKNLKKWEKMLKENQITPQNSFIFVVGNKSDLKSRLQVDYPEVSKFCKTKGYEYFQASACSGENVQEIFDKLFYKVVQEIDEKRMKVKRLEL